MAFETKKFLDSTGVTKLWAKIEEELALRDAAIEAAEELVTTSIEALDSSVSATAASGNEYSVLTGVTEADGKLTGKTEVKLAAVAKTGAAADVSVADTDDNFTSSTLEDVLAELADKIEVGGDGSVVTVEKSTNVEGVAARYTFKQGGNAIANGVIDIPKDMVVSSGSVVTNPSGQPAGTYLKLILANATNDTIYINVSSLIEYVTSGSSTGDMVVVNVDADHKVTASITDGTVTLAKLAAAVQTEINKAHVHDNKTVLDGITAAKVSAWDSAEQNAKDYADGLDEATNARIDDVEDLLGDESVADQISAEIAKLDATPSQVAGADGLALSITEVDGKITAISGSIAANTYDEYGAADDALTDAKAYTDQQDTALLAAIIALTEAEINSAIAAAKA